MDIFNELLWPQFKKLNRVRNLPLHEQVVQYNQYLWDLSQARQNWLTNQNKGPRTTPTLPVEDGFLLQEDLFDLEQEDGSKIYITGYA
jgi:hypothetical protein